MTERVVFTPEAVALVAALKASHGPLIFHLSGGCCEGSAPMCFRQSDFRVGASDVLLGAIEGCPFYVGAAQFDYWSGCQIIVDVTTEGGDSFSLEAADGVRFAARSRLFTDAEGRGLERGRSAARGRKVRRSGALNGEGGAKSGDDVISGVDVGDVAGHRLGCVAHQERSERADIVGRHQPVLGARAAARSSSSSKCLRPDADRVATGAGEIALTRMPFSPSSTAMYRTDDFERRLDRPHEVIILDRLFSAVEGYRQQAAARLRHQGFGELRHSQEGMHGNLHGVGKPARRAIDERPDPADPPRGRAKLTGVKREVEPSPFGGDFFEDRLELAFDGDVALTSDLAPQFLDKRATYRSVLLFR